MGRPRPSGRGRPFRTSIWVLLVFAAVAALPVPSPSVARGAEAAVGPNSDPRDRTEHSGGHEDEGVALRAATAETIERGGRCPAQARERRYAVVAISVDITVNRYLDHDPEGRMFALETDVARVRAEERANRQARTSAAADAAVSLGLQGDAIQPLTLRARPGECLRVRLRNDLPRGEPVSFHLHGSELLVRSTGRPAVAAESATIAHDGGLDVVMDRCLSVEWRRLGRRSTERA